MKALRFLVLCGAIVISTACSEKSAPLPVASPFQPPKPGGPTEPAQNQPPAAKPGETAGQDGVKDAPRVCNKAENPACAVDIDPKLAAEHGPALAMDGDKFGQGVTLAESVKISDLAADPEKYAGRRVRIEGQVEDVCQMAGCWFTVKSDIAGKTMKFKVTDGVMVFPMSAKGKYAVAEGTVRKMQLNLEATKKVLAHEAEEQGRPFDPATVTEALTIVRIDGLGAVIRVKK